MEPALVQMYTYYGPSFWSACFRWLESYFLDSSVGLDQLLWPTLLLTDNLIHLEVAFEHQKISHQKISWCFNSYTVACCWTRNVSFRITGSMHYIIYPEMFDNSRRIVLDLFLKICSARTEMIGLFFYLKPSADT